MIKKIKLSSWMIGLLAIFIMVAILSEEANACDYECVIVCTGIGVSCLNANPYDQYDNPWGYGEHIDLCRNLYDLCMIQAFLQ